jgi:hypothetical protein
LQLDTTNLYWQADSKTNQIAKVTLTLVVIRIFLSLRLAV